MTRISFFSTILGALFFFASADQTFADGWQLIPQIGHSGDISTIDVSHDGKLIASGGHEGEIFIWDAKSLILLKRIAGHKDWIDRLRFVPGSDLVVSKSKDRTVKQWDILTGREVLTYDLGTDSAADFVFSDTSNLTAIRTFSGHVHIFDIEGRRIGSPVHIAEAYKPFALDFDRTGNVLIAGADNWLMRLSGEDFADWHFLPLEIDAEDLPKSPFETGGGVTSLVNLHWDSENFFAVSYGGGGVELRRLEDFSVVWRTNLETKSDTDFKMTFSQVRQSLDKAALEVLWDFRWSRLDLKTGTLLDEKSTRGEQSLPWMRILLPSGPEVRVIEAEGTLSSETLALFDQQGQLMATGAPPALEIFDLQGSVVNGQIAIASRDIDDVKIIDPLKRKIVSVLGVPGVSPSQVAISADGARVAAIGSCGGGGAVWDVETHKILRVLGSAPCTHVSLNLSPDGQRVMHPKRDRSVPVMTVESTKAHLVKDKDFEPASPVMSPDGTIVVAGSSDFGTRVYVAETNEIIGEIDTGPLSWVLASSKGTGGWVAGSHRGTVTVGNWRGELVRSFPSDTNPSQRITALALDQNGETAYSGDEGGRVCSRSVKSGESECFDVLGLPVNSLDLISDDRYLAVADRGQTGHIYSTDTLREVLRFWHTNDGLVVMDINTRKVNLIGSITCVEVKDFEWRECA